MNLVIELLVGCLRVTLSSSKALELVELGTLDETFLATTAVICPLDHGTYVVFIRIKHDHQLEGGNLLDAHVTIDA